jgi:hypothetical protein
MLQDIFGTVRGGFRVGTGIARDAGCRCPKRPMSVVVSRDHLPTLRSMCHSTVAICLETGYQAQWLPVAGFEEHAMRSTFAVRQRAYPQTIYQLSIPDQATIPQAWQPIILLLAIAPQPP